MRAPAFLVIGLLAVGLLPVSSGLAQENDYLIVPGQQVGRWEGTVGGRAYYDGYSFLPAPGRPYLQAYACRNDGLVFAILVVRRLDLELRPGAEEFKYRTTDGVRIGMIVK